MRCLSQHTRLPIISKILQEHWLCKETSAGAVVPGKSSGRTRWVAPKTCQTTGSEPAAMERPCSAANSPHMTDS